MKTIEERAFEFACKNDKPSSFFCDLEKSYKVGATEQKAIDMEGFKNLVKREFNSLYELYIRKAGCNSEYSRTVAPSQMDAIDTLKNTILKAMEE